MTVDLIDDPIEETTVESFGHGVASFLGLFQRIIAGDDFAVSDDAHRCQRFHQLGRVDSQQFGDCCKPKQRVIQCLEMKQLGETGA